MRAIARLAQLEAGAPGDDLDAELNEGGDDLAQIHQRGAAAIERQHVDAEGRLQRRVPEQLVHHHFGRGIALDLDDHAHAVAVRLVAQIGDTLDQLLAHHLGDAFEQALLVDLIGDLVDHDGVAVLADLLDDMAAAHHDRAAAGLIGRADAGPAHDQPARREIRARDDLGQLLDREVGIVDQRQGGIDHLAQIMRRDIGRHAHGDAGGAIDQQIGKLRRQNRRFLQRLVVIRHHIDGILVDIGEQAVAHPGEPRLGIALRRRRIAIHRPEITLPLDQRHPHREILRHAHHGVVDRRVAMRVEIAHHLADHLGRFAKRPVPVVAGFLHGVEDAAMDRLQPVADIGQCSAHDHAHRVIEIGALHLVFDRDGGNVERSRCRRLRDQGIRTIGCLENGRPRDLGKRSGRAAGP